MVLLRKSIPQNHNFQTAVEHGVRFSNYMVLDMEQNPYTPSPTGLDGGARKNKGGFLKLIKKIFIGIGILFVVILALLVWVGFSTNKVYKRFEHTAEPFINKFLSDQSPWNYEKSKPYLSKAWLQITSDADGNKLFTFFNKLGAFKSVDSIEWQGCNSSKHTEHGSIQRCNYVVKASYEEGAAVNLMGLALELEEIRVMQLKVNSDVFIQ